MSLYHVWQLIWEMSFDFSILAEIVMFIMLLKYVAPEPTVLTVSLISVVNVEHTLHITDCYL